MFWLRNKEIELLLRTLRVMQMICPRSTLLGCSLLSSRKQSEKLFFVSIASLQNENDLKILVYQHHEVSTKYTAITLRIIKFDIYIYIMKYIK